MKVSTLEIYDIFQKELKLSELSAKKVTQYLEDANAAKIVTSVERKGENLATKEDLVRDIGKLNTKISDIKSEIIKRMFIFWIGQIGATLGIVYFLLKK